MPHYRCQRRAASLRRLAQQHPFGLHVHVGIRGADRAVAVTNSLRNFLPEILALSASSPFVESVNTGLLGEDADLHALLPRCGVPDAFASWQQYEDYVRFLYGTAPSPSTRSSGRACARISAFRPWRSGSPTASPTSQRRSHSLPSAPRSRPDARAHDEGEPLADRPHRLIEENMWRAIRCGLAAS